jgi:hypothetical protein
MRSFLYALFARLYGHYSLPDITTCVARPRPSRQPVGPACHELSRFLSDRGAKQERSNRRPRIKLRIDRRDQSLMGNALAIEQSADNLRAFP